MNVVATNPQELGQAELAKRKAAVEYARASLRLEGFVLPDFAEELNRRYIAGEITREAKTTALLDHYSR